MFSVDEKEVSGLLKKLLASIRVGGIKVDTTLEKGEYRQGETIHGRVLIQGSSVQQEINRILFQLKVRLRDRGVGVSGFRDFLWHTHEIADKITVLPKETKEIPFSFTLPDVTPISFPYEGHFLFAKPKVSPYCFQVYLQTGIDIEHSIDPSDHDEIQIAPHPFVEEVLKSMSRLGFSVTSVEPNSMDYPMDRTFYQEFLFAQHDMKNWLSEASLVHLGNGHFVLRIETQKPDYRSIMEMLDVNERKIRFVVHEEDIEDKGIHLTEYLAEQIQLIQNKVTKELSSNE